MRTITRARAPIKEIVQQTRRMAMPGRRQETSRIVRTARIREIRRITRSGQPPEMPTIIGRARRPIRGTKAPTPPTGHPPCQAMRMPAQTIAWARTIHLPGLHPAIADSDKLAEPGQPQGIHLPLALPREIRTCLGLQTTHSQPRVPRPNRRIANNLQTMAELSGESAIQRVIEPQAIEVRPAWARTPSLTTPPRAGRGSHEKENSMGWRK